MAPGSVQAISDQSGIRRARADFPANLNSSFSWHFEFPVSLFFEHGYCVIQL
jgi:hypothetical protein